MEATFNLRLNQILAGLRQAVAARLAHGMTGFLIMRICARFSFIATHLPQALARAALPTRRRLSRPSLPRPPKPPGHPADAWRSIRLPRREGWLHRLMPQAANAQAGYLRHLLAEPDMAALAATPRAHRLLRPLCRMLGITDCLPPLAPPGGPPATPTPAAVSTRPQPPPPPVTDRWAACAMPSQPIAHIWPPYRILPTA